MIPKVQQKRGNIKYTPKSDESMCERKKIKCLVYATDVTRCQDSLGKYSSSI